MNKITFLLISTTFIILTTLVVNSLELDNIDEGIDVPTNIDDSIGSALSIIGTFMNLLTFQLDAVPTLFNLVFSIVAMGIIYIIVDIVKDLIPFA